MRWLTVRRLEGVGFMLLIGYVAEMFFGRGHGFDWVVFILAPLALLGIGALLPNRPATKRPGEWWRDY